MLMLAARFGVVARILLRHAPIFAMLLLPPLISALAEGLRGLSIALGTPAVLAVAAGLAGRRVDLPDDLRRVEAMAALGLVFVIGIAVSVPAFMVLGLGPVDAIFEATSGITTTGLTMVPDTAGWPVTAHVLRAWLQWCGGLAIATAAAALLLEPGLPAQLIGSAGMENEDYLTSTRHHARQLLVVYVVLTLVGVAGCMALLPTLWEALVLPLAAVSTGGFAPRPDSLASYDLGAQLLIVGLSYAGSISLFTMILLGRRKFGTALRKTTLPLYLGVTAGGLVAIGAWSLAVGDRDPVSDMLIYVSAQSTAGFSTGPVGGGAGVGPAGLLLLMVAMVIGGDMGSTAGGLKLARVVSLVEMLRISLARVRMPPHAVVYLRHLGRRVKPEQIVAISAVFGLYAGSAGLLWFAFLATGAPALPALFDIVSALSTVGLGAGAVGPDIAPGLKLLTALAMLLGRLEFIVVIVMLSPRTWIMRR